MRTPEVEAAMKRSVTDTELVETKTPPWNRETLASVDRRVLAAEVERLEKALATFTSDATWQIEIERQRAETAEARVAELLARPGPEETWRADAGWARVAELEAQNAQLREALEFLLIGYEGLGGDMENNAPQMAKAALADTKGTP